MVELEKPVDKIFGIRERESKENGCWSWRNSTDQQRYAEYSHLGNGFTRFFGGAKETLLEHECWEFQNGSKIETNLKIIWWCVSKSSDSVVNYRRFKSKRRWIVIYKWGKY